VRMNPEQSASAALGSMMLLPRSVHDPMPPDVASGSPREGHEWLKSWKLIVSVAAPQRSNSLGRLRLLVVGRTSPLPVGILVVNRFPPRITTIAANNP
jgi:hypothetical protein